MHFQLPTNLQTELIPYDPTLKKLAMQDKPKTTKTKQTKYPLGQPPVLIPNDVVRESLYTDAIDNINSNKAPDRFHEFRLPVGTIPNVEFVTHAIIYHWEGMWVAAWLPPKGKESEYIYGYTYCYKDIASAKKLLPHDIRTDDTFIREKNGRSEYLLKTVLVTKEMVIASEKMRERKWYRCCRYTMKGRDIGAAVNRFEKQLRESIPTWEDGGNIFERIYTNNNLFSILFGYYSYGHNAEKLTDYFKNCEIKYGMPKDKWKPTPDTLLELSQWTTAMCLPHLIGVKHILNKPFFRKWIQAQCERSIQRFNDPTNRFKKKIVAPIKLINQLSELVGKINEIWPDAPIDYYQNNLDVLLGTRSFYTFSKASEWLNDNMPVASFFQMLNKHYVERCAEYAKHKRSFEYEDSIEHVLFRFHSLEDTMQMLNHVLDQGKTIDPPNRWRITEFHDHVQAESWKIKNPNHSLPQDLFPEPIKVMRQEDSWSFFQPYDTHQLSQWGQAVRNCVGNAASYAEGVRKKQHFIVLGMLNGKPTFTIQLKVNMGVMSVEQIVGYANTRLSDTERQTYSEVFRMALHSREEQLASNS